MMKEIFKKQMDDATPVTIDTLNELGKKTYENGENIQIGDKVLFALLIDGIEDITVFDVDIETPLSREMDETLPRLEMELVTINERHFDQYKEYNRAKGSEIPIITRK